MHITQTSAHHILAGGLATPLAASVVMLLVRTRSRAGRRPATNPDR